MRKFILFISLFIITIGYLAGTRMKKTVWMSLSGPWNSVHPALQHTMYGDLLLMNVFDPLVLLGRDGKIKPLGAKKWLISEDQKTYEFEIDTTKRFSDGTRLSAQAYKSAWLNGLSLDAKSANSSLQDVLYDLVGFEGFSKNQNIDGIVVVDSAHLVIRLNAPNRMFLQHLAGVRYSAWKVDNDKVIGSGKYVIERADQNMVSLSPNPYHENHTQLDPVEISYFTKEQLQEKLRDPKFDGLAYGFSGSVDSALLTSDEMQLIAGPESTHVGFDINGHSGSGIFKDKHNRQALLYLMNKVSKQKAFFGDSRLFFHDVQMYLPYEQGRLTNDEVSDLISSYEEYVEKLVNASKLHPIVLYKRPGIDDFVEALRLEGLRITVHNVYDYQEFFKYAYKEFPYDILYGSFSVVSGDPDGLYHALGKNGAILNPVVYRPLVGDLLEAGRKIVDFEKIDSHYKKVSRAVLEEVPFVQVGFSRSFSLIKKTNVVVEANNLVRNDVDFSIFKKK